MTKKIISFCFVVLHIFLLTACVEAKIVKKDIFFNTMNTFVNGHFYSEEQKAETLASEVKALFDTYDMLTDNFQQKGDVKGIYYINKAVEEGSETTTIEIDEKLYELIEFGLEVTVETDGYFDMSIGKIIDVWKELIEDYQTEAFVPEDILEATILAAEAIEIIEDPIQLEVIEGNHFITVKKGAKLDLGAIVKGYVLQKVVDYLESEGVQSYLISAGSSSLAFGEENPNRDSGNYVVGLINPLNPLSYYATYEAQGINITTSGSYEQYVEDEAGNWY